MRATFKRDVIELYCDRICKHYNLTREQFFTIKDEPGYDKRFNFARSLHMYLCRIRPIQQKEVQGFYEDNGVYYSHQYMSMQLIRFKTYMSKDRDLTYLINRLK
jgi:hypothetical protein